MKINGARILVTSMVLALSLGLVGSAVAAPKPMSAPSQEVTEDFHGPRPETDLQVAAQLGLGVLDATGGFNLVGSVAKKILHRGFIEDISNQAFVELQLGPNFLSGGTAWFYSTHLRWDFRKDAAWTFFALGGLSGHFSGQSLGDRATLLPRFGVGAFWTLTPQVTLRGDFSRELTAVGVSFGF